MAAGSNRYPSSHTPGHAMDYAGIRGHLLAYLRSLTGDPQLAEDLFHDVILKTLAAEMKTGARPDNMEAWLIAAARNAAIDHIRKNRRSGLQHNDGVSFETFADKSIADESRPDEKGPDESGMAVEILSYCLRPMMERLPEKYRKILMAFELERMSLKAISEREGLSLSAVKSRLSRAREMLREILVGCCKVRVSPNGSIEDYDSETANGCIPRDGTAHKS